MALEKQNLVFISYSRNNKDFALELANELRASGFNIWFDLLDIPTGSRWDDEIERALEQCEIFMVILTPSSTISDNVKDEIGYAIDSDKRILPILLKDANVPLRLRRFQYVDFTDISYNEGIDQAKHLLRKLINEPAKSLLKSDSIKDQLSQSSSDRSAELQADAQRLARQKSEAIREAREKEQLERTSQVIPPATTFEKKVPQQKAQSQSSKLFPIIAGIIVIALLCMGGGWAVWRYILSPTETPLPPVPTTAVPITVTPSFTPTTKSPPEVLPTTPAPPSIVFPSDPVEFVKFYFDNINRRNYDLTWSLLSDEYTKKLNSDGKIPYTETWNKVPRVELDSISEQYKISDNEVVVIIGSNLQAEKLSYFLRRDNAQSNWMFYLMDNACSDAPKRLSKGIAAEVVTNNDTLLLRTYPTDGARVEELQPKTRVVVDADTDPKCRYYRAGSVFLWWWKVRSPQGNQGWVVEGFDSRDPIFIQPAQ